MNKGLSIDQKTIQNSNYLIYWIYNFFCLSSKNEVKDDENIVEFDEKKFTVKVLMEVII